MISGQVISGREIMERARLLRDDLRQLLADLVRIPTVNPPGTYGPIYDRLESWLKRNGLFSHRVPVPRHLTDAEGLTPRENLLASVIPFEGTPKHNRNQLVLSAHVDTVHPGDPTLWCYHPYGAQVHNGRLYGRGAADSKGCLVCYAGVLALLKSLGLDEPPKVVLAATCDEETGGEWGIQYLLNVGLLSGRWAIVEGYHDRVTVVRTVGLEVKVTLSGKAAHGARPWLGVSTVAALPDLIRGLEQLVQCIPTSLDVPGLEPGSVVNIAPIRAGDSPDAVAHHAEVTARYQLVPSVPVSEFLTHLESFFAREQSRLPAGLSLEWAVTGHWPGVRASQDSPIVRALIQAGIELDIGIDFPLVGDYGYTDGSWLAAKGFEVVHFGPVDTHCRAHAPNESVDLDKLVEAAAVIAHAAIILSKQA